MIALASGILSVAAALVTAAALGELSAGIDKAGFKKERYDQAREYENKGRQLLEKGQVFLARDSFWDAKWKYEHMGDKKKAEELSNIINECNRTINNT